MTNEYQEDLFKGAESNLVVLAVSKMGSTQDGQIFQFILRRNQDGTNAGAMLERFSDKPYSTVTTAPSKFYKKGLIYYRGDYATGKSGKRMAIIRVERRQVASGLLPGIPERRDLPPDYDDPEISDPLEVVTDTPGNVDPVIDPVPESMLIRTLRKINFRP